MIISAIRHRSGAFTRLAAVGRGWALTLPLWLGTATMATTPAADAEGMTCPQQHVCVTAVDQEQTAEDQPIRFVATLLVREGGKASCVVFGSVDFSHSSWTPEEVQQLQAALPEAAETMRLTIANKKQVLVELPPRPRDPDVAEPQNWFAVSKHGLSFSFVYSHDDAHQLVTRKFFEQLQAKDSPLIMTVRFLTTRTQRYRFKYSVNRLAAAVRNAAGEDADSFSIESFSAAFAPKQQVVIWEPSPKDETTYRAAAERELIRLEKLGFVTNLPTAEGMPQRVRFSDKAKLPLALSAHETVTSSQPNAAVLSVKELELAAKGTFLRKLERLND